MNFQPRSIEPAVLTGASFILLLVAVSAISPLALNIFVPAMPGMQRVFGVDFATVQLTLSLYFAGIALSQIVIGPLSDRFGRRPVLVAGLALFVAASAVCAAAPSIEVLILGRIVQAAGGCTGLVLSRAIVRDLYEREEAASMIGYVTMGMAVAPMVAPAIGGAIDTWSGWRGIFVFVGLAGAATLALAVLRLPETNRMSTPTPPAALARAYGGLIRSPAFWGYTLTGAFGSLCFFAFLSGANYVMTELFGRTSAEYGAYFPLTAFGYILGNFCAGRLSVRLGTGTMLTLGNVVTALGVALMAGLFAAGLHHPLSLFTPMLLVGVGNGMMLPSAVAGAISVRPDLAGAASGLSGMVQMGFGAVVSPIVGATLDDTAWPLVVIMAAGAVLAILARLLLAVNRPSGG